MVKVKELRQRLSKDELAQLFDAGVTQANVAKQFNVCPSQISTLAKEYGLKPTRTSRHWRDYKSPPLCRICGETDPTKFYRTNSCMCKVHQVQQGVESKRNFRKFIVEYKGGKCILCNYDKVCGLDFHHLDPSTKDYKLSQKIYSLKKPTLDKVQKELDKCVLLCKNCHAEVHAGVVSLPT